jgi:hypothetical protein
MERVVFETRVLPANQRTVGWRILHIAVVLIGKKLRFSFLEHHREIILQSNINMVAEMKLLRLVPFFIKKKTLISTSSDTQNLILLKQDYW